MAHLVQSKSFYHGLPVFSEDLTGLTAIVTGANGISGDYMLRVLCESPRRWTKIYALSRRPPNGVWPEHVQHVAVDLLRPAEEVASELQQRGIKGDYVFFYSYVQPPPKGDGGIWSAAEEMVRVNRSLLANFLDALALNQTTPKRVLVQFGVKYYGLHLGPAATPQEESDPRVHLEANFYYAQEDVLKEFAQKHGVGWTTTLPSVVLGAVLDASMNVCLPLAIYATTQKFLNGSLDYPSDFSAWENTVTMSSSKLNGYLAEWAVLTDAAKNERFNAADDSPFTWSKAWPKLAARFGIPWTGPATGDGVSYLEMSTPYRPPPRGYGPPATLRARFTLSKWAKRPEVESAWRQIAEESALRIKELKDMDALFQYADTVLLVSFPISLSMNKAKKLGFFGFVDSGESMMHVIEEIAGLKMIPPLP